jgi:ABC-type amino acid transport substrate-binding protein
MKRILLLLTVLAAAAGNTAAQPVEQEEYESRTLVVGTMVAPPFAIKNSDASWSGISIDLWRRIAEELHLTYEFQERELGSLVGGLSDGSLDAVVTALPISAEWEEELDFTAAFYTTGLAMATSSESGVDWRGIVRMLASYRLLQVLGLLALILLVVGAVVFLFERKRNPDEFGGDASTGLWSGFWYAAVTATTIGYGDKVPRTAGGRIVALIWMFTAVVAISSFTASITSTITVSRLASPTYTADDLPDLRVGSVFGSTAAVYLEQHRIKFKSYKTPLEGLREVALGRLDVVVYDSPILQHLAKTRLQGKIKVLPTTLQVHDYAIGLREGSSLRERVNRVLLRKIHQSDWQDVLQRYLGERPES